MERIKLALQFAAHELGVEIRLEPSDVINGNGRTGVRKLISVLKSIKSKQTEVLISQFKNSENYSQLVESICYCDAASQRHTNLKHHNQVHDALRKSVSKNALYEKLASDCSLVDVSNDFLYVKGNVDWFTSKRKDFFDEQLKTESKRAINCGLLDQREGNKTCGKVRRKILQERLNTISQSIKELKIKSTTELSQQNSNMIIEAGQVTNFDGNLKSNRNENHLMNVDHAKDNYDLMGLKNDKKMENCAAFETIIRSSGGKENPSNEIEGEEMINATETNVNEECKEKLLKLKFGEKQSSMGSVVNQITKLVRANNRIPKGFHE